MLFIPTNKKRRPEGRRYSLTTVAVEEELGFLSATMAMQIHRIGQSIVVSTDPPRNRNLDDTSGPRVDHKRTLVLMRDDGQMGHWRLHSETSRRWLDAYGSPFNMGRHPTAFLIAKLSRLINSVNSNHQ